jgi:hypothetical protein
MRRKGSIFISYSRRGGWVVLFLKLRPWRGFDHLLHTEHRFMELKGNVQDLIRRIFHPILRGAPLCKYLQVKIKVNFRSAY